MVFRSKGQQWRKRNRNDDVQYQIPDQGSIGHTKDQQSRRRELNCFFFNENLVRLFA